MNAIDDGEAEKVQVDADLNYEPVKASKKQLSKAELLGQSLVLLSAG
jgi:hypothetical protein